MRTETDVRAAETFDGKYLSVTSYRRDGRGVSTPVWFVRDGQRLLIETDVDSFKVKRMRREPRVAIARCTMRGKIRELPTPGESEFLPDDQVRRVERLMAHKYRVEVLIFRPLRAIQRALHVGRYRGTPVIVAITPAAEPS